MKRILGVLLLLCMVCSMLVQPAFAAYDYESDEDLENECGITFNSNGTMYILAQPQNYVYNEGAVAIYYVTVAGENLKCTWYLDFDGKTYDLSDPNATGPWINYVTGDCGSAEEQDNLGFTPSHTTFSYHFAGCEEGLNGAYIYAEIYDGRNTIVSSKAMIQLSEGAKSPPHVYVPVEMEICKGDKVELECSATAIYGGRLSYTWYETPDGDLTKIQAINRGKETNATLVCDTNSYGTRYYVCSVEEAGGGSAYSSVISVTVMESRPTEPDNATEPVTESQPTVPENTEPVTEPESSGNAEVTTPEKAEGNDPAENNDKVWTYIAFALGTAVVGMGIAIVLLLKKK